MKLLIEKGLGSENPALKKPDAGWFDEMIPSRCKASSKPKWHCSRGRIPGSGGPVVEEPGGKGRRRQAEDRTVGHRRCIERRAVGGQQGGSL